MHEVVAGAHFAAEAVAAGGDGHGVRPVGRGLNEDRDLEAGEANGVDDAALFTEVREGNDNAVNLVGVLFEQVGATLRFYVGFDGAIRRILGPEDDGACARGLKNLDDFVAACFCEVTWEKSAIAHHDTKCHCTFRSHFLYSLVRSRICGVFLLMYGAENSTLLRALDET